MSSLLTDIYRLFFPSVCGSCRKPLGDSESFLCNACRWELPLTGFPFAEHNPVADKFYGHFPLGHASSYFYFVRESSFQEIIHRMKYAGGWKLGHTLGRWFGQELLESGRYDHIDALVPVPLHWKRRLGRGYNQSEYIAEGISSVLGKPVDTKIIRRARHNPSQTKRNRSDRWDNVAGIFEVPHPDLHAGKHILLVDDVLTTGSTLISCGETLAARIPDCRVSVATLAVSKAELEKPKKL